MKFQPPPVQVPDDVLNVWAGFPTLNTPLPADIDINDNQYINKFHNHLQMLFDDDRIVNFIDAWIAAKIQNPAKKNE
eukprot:522412-Hanusia_phi.AAC.1